MAFAPVWQLFYGLLIALLVVQLGMRLMAVVNQFYAGRKALELATNLLGVVALGSIAFAKEYFVPVSASANLHKLAEVNHAMGLAFRIALLCAVVGLLVEGWKLVKARVPVERLAF